MRDDQKGTLSGIHNLVVKKTQTVKKNVNNTVLRQGFGSKWTTIAKERATALKTTLGFSLVIWLSLGLAVYGI